MLENVYLYGLLCVNLITKHKRDMSEIVLILKPLTYRQMCWNYKWSKNEKCSKKIKNV